MKLQDLNLSTFAPEEKEIFINGISVKVKQTLSINEKVDFINWVLSYAIDDSGIYSPVRISVYTLLAVVKWYSDIELSEKDIEQAPNTYDLLLAEKVYSTIVANISESDYEDLLALLTQSIEEYSKYTYSVLGIIQNLSSSSNELVAQAEKILESVKNREGIELLSSIKDIVGQK